MTLTDELGAEDCDLRAGAADDALCGTVPAHVARPADTGALGRAMAVAARHGLAVAARGNGTALDWGGVPDALDLLVDTAGLSWIDHVAGDLVVEVGAGTPVAELYEVLAAAGQRLSADPVRSGGTVGGMVATGVSGPRRLLTGALRDLIIGMTVVRADGVVARSGGRVVKNVAGYDLAKLHTGGMGTLGVIASVAFRLHPVPPALRVVSVRPSSRAHAERMVAALRATTVVPSAVELHRPAASPADSSGALSPSRGPAPSPPGLLPPDRGCGLRVVLEGTPAGLDARVATVCAALRGAAPDDDPRVDEELPRGWGLLPVEGTIARVSVPPAESLAAAARIAELAAAVGVDVGVGGSVARGALHASFPPGTGAAAVEEVVDGARSRPGWSVTLLRAEPHVHAAGVDLWGEVPGLPLMRAVKDSFDPGHRLAPGRFAGGI